MTHAHMMYICTHMLYKCTHMMYKYTRLHGLCDVHTHICTRFHNVTCARLVMNTHTHMMYIHLHAHGMCTLACILESGGKSCE